MTLVPVGDHLEDDGAVASKGVLGSMLDSLVNGENVHGIDLKTRNDITSSVVRSVHLREEGRVSGRVRVEANVGNGYGPSLLTDDLSALVPIPYLLFSHTKTHGSFHRAAMLKDSNTCPWLEAPSPYMAKTASWRPRYC